MQYVDEKFPQQTSNMYNWGVGAVYIYKNEKGSLTLLHKPSATMTTKEATESLGDELIHLKTKYVKF